MRTSLLVVPLLAACSYPRYVATKVVEYDIPAAGTSQLLCQTHNGDIGVTSTDASQIAVHAVLSVRGYTQAEADANLDLLDVGRDQKDGTLHLFVEYPNEGLANCSPCGNFTLKVPESLGLDLASHNGNLAVQGTRGNLRLETHNGSIDARIGSNSVATTTHNGNIRLSLSGSGALNGQVVSHNGNIEMELPAGIGTMLEASTTNGRVVGPAQATEASHEQHRLRCRIGDGNGSLVASTHNGNVKIR